MPIAVLKARFIDICLERMNVSSAIDVKIPFTRIDYILHDNKFKTKSYFLDNNEYSDHYPIITKIDFLE